MEAKTILFIIFVLAILYLLSCKSKFNNIEMQMNQNYSTPGNCIRNDREYPEGKIPGSYLGLNRYERAELLKRFIDNSPYLE
jgi:hypothetical protein